MANQSPNPIYFNLDSNQFWIIDNLERRYDMRGGFNDRSFCTVAGFPSIEVTIESGKKFNHSSLAGGWNMQFFVPVTDPKITTLTLHVNKLERIDHAQWQISIR
jgi:hypothetical protein